MHLRTILTAATLLLLLAPAGASHAQTGDEAAIRAVVDGVFDAMRAGDGAALGAFFHPEATLKSVGERGGQVQVRREEVAAFVTAVGTPREETLDERISNVQIQVDGPLATAWMDYEFYFGGRFSHCGVNAFEFVRTAQGWRVLGITDTRRTTGCAGAPAGG